MARAPKEPKRPSRRASRGFILVIVLGMLAVLAILGLAFAEQGRVDLMGARNAAEVGIADELAEAGFEMAMRALADDRNAPSPRNPGWNASQGTGWTGRWAYNPYDATAVSAGGIQPGDPAPSHADKRTTLESWQAVFWDEEDKGDNAAFGYNFQFDLAKPETKVAQRHPTDEKVMMNAWQRQPLQRNKRFRFRIGNSFGRIQIAITPKDGGVNLNDVFEAGTVDEYPGVYERLEMASTDANIPYASPDRRTLEYVLGKRPEWANRGPELMSSDPDQLLDHTETQPYANLPHGNLTRDDGVYNFRRYPEPNGQAYDPGTLNSFLNEAWLTDAPAGSPTTFYNAGKGQPNRYNFEHPRYACWSSTTGMSLLKDHGNLGKLTKAGFAIWYPSGRFRSGSVLTGNPWYNSSYPDAGQVDCLFTGFGFDLRNPLRGGQGGAPALAKVYASFPSTDPLGETKYIGAGLYGHYKPATHQRHYVCVVQQGRFWSDLHANWYFGGAPGYNAAVGPPSTSDRINNWLHLGSSYDSMGLGSNWMTPTQHVWGVGFWNSGRPHAHDTQRGVSRYPGNMPPAKPAATYAYPLKKWSDDLGLANTQFLFNDARVSLRAAGVQENWGLWGADDAKGRFYDAININVSNFQVVYGLLTPEKLPSMLQRTVVAPHLHWKARLLDGAYVQHDQFGRYNPNTFAPEPYNAWEGVFTDADNNLAADDVLPGPADGIPDRNDAKLPYGAYNPDAAGTKFRYFHADPTGTGLATAAGKIWPAPTAEDTDLIGPSYYKWSIHRAYLQRSDLLPLSLGLPAATAPDITGVAEAGRVLLGKMDFVTPEPLEWKDETGAIVRHGTGQPADDVFTGVNYDLNLYDPASFDVNQTAHALSNSSQICRPIRLNNYADWFLQRKAAIPDSFEALPVRCPNTNKPAGMSHPEGKLPAVGAALPGAAAASRSRQDPAQPHPVWGLPNPDYMLLHPGSEVSAYWSDQYRRYFPVFGGLGGQAPPGNKRAIDLYLSVPSPQQEYVRPYAPAPKVASQPQPGDPFVPAIGRDEAWRITRIGRKYQEIVADEIMDYQMNPHWPNPCIHGLTNANELAATLSKTAYVSPTRQNALASSPASPKWRGLSEYNTEPGIAYQIPDYWAYFNRFWVRGGGLYTRAHRGWVEAYRETTGAAGELPNPVENPGIYPQSFQYFGQLPAPHAKFADWIMDFPYNTLEDQSGCEWRYVSGVVQAMAQPLGRSAPARNHPFRNWADFVAFLGHLVYRAPIHVSADATGSDGKRHRRFGVKATAAKGAPAGGTFFDGSNLAGGDALQEPTVARAGYWPIAANYGEWAQSAEGYPPAAASWAGDVDEWKRRMDEWRGRDAAGLRVEHHYISEAAANDVLVSFSNARIAPIDFDGDGHVTMTRKSELPDPGNVFWTGYPWHASGAGNIAGVEHRRLETTAHGDSVWKGQWDATPKDQIIQGCVTLPIKFRSNTFRIAVLVELTDPTYTNVYAVRRYSRVVSRVPGAPAGGTKVHGPFTGEFILHGTRVMTGVDPYLEWLGTK